MPNTVTETGDELGYEIALDDLPCTFDCPVEEGGDRVLETLRIARERVARGHTRKRYLTKRGSVCALGGIVVADGHDEFDGFWDTIERQLSDDAKEAIACLNAAAARLYDCGNCTGDTGLTWQGPAEYINQELFRDEKRAGRKTKKAVLRCYDAAIADREALHA